MPGETVVTSLTQHNNNNYPSPRTKCWSLWLQKRRRAATTQQHHSFIDGKEVQIRERTSRVPLQPLNIQSSAAVSSGHIYNFHNCNVVFNWPRTGLWSNASSSFPSMQSQWKRCQQTILGTLILKLFKLTFPFWAWVIQSPSSMQNTSATICQHIQFQLLSFFGLCLKFDWSQSKTWAHSQWRLC